MTGSARRGIGVALLMTLGLAPAGRLAAHHSPAQYDESALVEKSATIVRFEFRNPHTYILVRDADGAEWLLETSSAVRLRRAGWNAESFSPGDRISFRAQANRNPDKNRLYLDSLTAADGRTYSAESEDDGSSEAGPVFSVDSLEGIWRVDTGNFGEVIATFRAHPLTEKALQAQDAYDESTDPVADCIAYPTPHLVFVSFIYPMRIELSEDVVTFHHEFFDTTRTVHMDGRGHPPGTVRSNQGHAIGTWDDGTLVVDTRYFAEHRNPMLGDFPSSTDKHVVERYSLSEDGTHATVAIFLEDPEYLAEPLRYELKLLPAPDEELQAFDCDPEIAKRFTQ